MSKDYHHSFDRVISKFLGEPPMVEGFPNYFQDDFDCRALLLAICVKEHDTNSSAYSAEEQKTMQLFIDALPENKQVFEKPLVISCIEFFEQKLQPEESIGT